MKYFTANEIRDRYREELVKFKIEIDSYAYLNDAAALTFSSANVSNSPELFVYNLVKFHIVLTLVVTTQ